MLGTEETLFDEYKRVDNICCDMFLIPSGISQYISEMERKSFYGRSMVSSWDVDYRKLKRVRWLRNQIAHELSATDCTGEDVAWLEEFHSRLLERRDPLALLEKKNRDRSSSPTQCGNEKKSNPKQRVSRNIQLQKRDDPSSKRRVTVSIWVAAVLVGLTVIALFLVFCWMMAV